ncbi:MULTISPECIES: hypothetical protein [Geobacillus]|jgi:hypothetical protein|uniref:Uncharacterized protein n=1 Tax=Geobacillus thermodenitrificans TaxID=33940 RepID=A0ABY9QH15_GEOTD|nr:MULTISPECIES: hypothetical protein [Geobacillus]ARA96737.1 hypothetical protein GD3902_00985 [Geobacillus thermodenitrificans]ARP42690.1 hypothetical protein GTHT12_01137 [Geobacillus thermodenitrificans]ATO36009.1 hypothetical protein GTID1_01545 [Geobacillus thermodenitrificans]KQB93489.1 hypothetical protein GEPA3_1631 [Geobacillus sp. PA-3]MED0661726.1 hypothetical protein [Geobacillus thermodenitrificans]
MVCVCNGGLFPQLFFTQSSTELPITIPVAGTAVTEVLRLEPITTLSNDLVKLDSMVELELSVLALLSGVALTGITYRLERSTNGGAFTPIAELDVESLLPVLALAANTTLFPNLTWVDNPGVGTHVYRIVIETDGSILGSLLSDITAETRALNALVVRNNA